MLEKQQILILEDKEHIFDLFITFSYESINSITITTNFNRTVEFGKKSEYTIMSKFVPSEKNPNGINVVTAFAGTLNKNKIKDFFVYRAPIQIEVDWFF